MVSNTCLDHAIYKMDVQTAALIFGAVLTVVSTILAICACVWAHVTARKKKKKIKAFHLENATDIEVSCNFFSSSVLSNISAGPVPACAT